MNHTLTAGELHNIIEEQIINPSVSEEIQTFVKSRKKWRKVSNVTETFGQLCIVASTILAFAGVFYRSEPSLGFAAGSINVASLAFLKFSTYAAGESSERNKLLNDLLIRCNVKPFEQQPTENNSQQSLVPERNIHYVTPNVSQEGDIEIQVY